MTYGIKTRPRLNSKSVVARNLKHNFWELDNKSQEIYGTPFSNLPIKQQDEISRKVAKGFHYKVN
jgi:hypothetical protein